MGSIARMALQGFVTVLSSYVEQKNAQVLSNLP